MESRDTLDILLKRLDALAGKQDALASEISALRQQIRQLQATQAPVKDGLQKSHADVPPRIIESSVPVVPEEKHIPTVTKPRIPRPKSDLEKFIGENLINKIGIVITILGVAVGAKYAIDHELISPLTRIILGYLLGLGLAGVGIRLKKNYENFSAVLFSGGLAILYFITYAAFSFYGLIPPVGAFALMVAITGIAVAAAMWYDQQVVAVIGLVGAYAVPYLVGETDGDVTIFFGYMAMINIGIMIIAFLKYWKLLFNSAFVLTWLVYLTWFTLEMIHTSEVTMGLIFAAIFFLTFYCTFLAYKIIKKKQFVLPDVIVLLLNSFVFYGVGYGLLMTTAAGKELLGLFTLANAVLHFGISMIIYRQQLADRRLFYFVTGLVLTFLTIAIPVQLDGNWVTLLWTGEALLLFWVGRTRQAPMYEKLSYFLMLLAGFSLLHDWNESYGAYYDGDPNTYITPVLNVCFLTSLLFIIAFGAISILRRNPRFEVPEFARTGIFSMFSFLIPAILLGAIFFSVWMEVTTYWDQAFVDSLVEFRPPGEDYTNSYYNYDLKSFRDICLVDYTLLFMSILSLVNLKRLKKGTLGVMNVLMNTIAIGAFLTIALYEISELRESYLDAATDITFSHTAWNIYIRYISFLFVGVMLYCYYLYTKQGFMRQQFKVLFDLVLYISLLWILTSELLHWLDIGNSSQSYKLGLSILWGVYSLFLISLGIWKKKKHLRIVAIVLFAVTLIKLFFYDISALDTISKTIVFVSLGILLLIISFLYNKFRRVISGEAAT